MRPVAQTLLHQPDGQNGNCFAACIASVFEVPIDDVPNFVDYHGPLGWWDAVRAWCRERGFDIGRIDSLDAVQVWAEGPPGDHAIATIQSPRGDWDHSVVINRDRVVVHDPYPGAPTGHVLDASEIKELEIIVCAYEPYPTQPLDLR